MPRPEEQEGQSDLDLVEGVLVNLTDNGQRLVTYAELSRQVMINHPDFKKRQETRRGRMADRIRGWLGRPLGDEAIGIPFKYNQVTSTAMDELTAESRLEYLYRHPESGEPTRERPQPLPSAGQSPLVRLYHYIPPSAVEMVQIESAPPVANSDRTVRRMPSAGVM